MRQMCDRGIPFFPLPDPFPTLIFMSLFGASLLCFFRVTAARHRQRDRPSLALNFRSFTSE